jgi:hypothetical protein
VTDIVTTIPTAASATAAATATATDDDDDDDNDDNNKYNAINNIRRTELAVIMIICNQLCFKQSVIRVVCAV